MIAYCLSGHTRGLEYNLPMPSAYFKNLGIDFFISTWEYQATGQLFWQGGIEIENPIDVEALVRNYSPVKLEIEKRSDYSDLFHFDYQFPSDPRVNVLNTLLMWKKIKKTFEMVDSTYDVIVRSRFDLSHLYNVKLEVEPGKIYGRYSSMNGFTSDIFFYGDRETMIKSIPDESFYTEETINTCVNAENVFQNHLTKQGIQFVAVPDLGFVLKNEIRY